MVSAQKDAKEVALVWRWELNSDKPVLIDAADNLNSAMKDNRAALERTYGLSRENVQVSQDDKDRCIRISSKDGTPLPRAFVDQIISSALNRARASRGKLGAAELVVEKTVPEQAPTGTKGFEARIAELEKELSQTRHDFGAERKGYESELMRVGEELERQKRGNDTLVTRVKEEGKRVLAHASRIKELEAELEKIRIAATGKPADGALPVLANWSKMIGRMNGQLTAVLGEQLNGTEMFTDSDLLGVAGAAQMSETDYIKHKLKQSLPDADEGEIGKLLNLPPWEQSEVHQRMAPEVKAAQEKIDFTKQMRATGVVIPESVLRALNIGEADALLSEFAEEKKRYEEQSEAAARVSQFKGEHKKALELRQVAAPWGDEQAIPMLILTGDRKNYRLSFPVSEGEDHTFESILGDLVMKIASEDGFSAQWSASEPGIVAITETNSDRLIFQHFTTFLADRLSASGLSEFGLKFDIYSLTRAKSTPNPALHKHLRAEGESKPAPEQPSA